MSLSFSCRFQGLEPSHFQTLRSQDPCDSKCKSVLQVKAFHSSGLAGFGNSQGRGRMESGRRKELLGEVLPPRLRQESQDEG